VLSQNVGEPNQYERMIEGSPARAWRCQPRSDGVRLDRHDHARYVTVTSGQLDAAIRQALGPTNSGQQVDNKPAEKQNAESGF
jgi:hypothetical protein